MMPLISRIPWPILAVAGVALMVIGVVHGGDLMQRGGPFQLGLILLVGSRVAYAVQLRPVTGSRSRRSYNGPGRGYYRREAVWMLLLGTIVAIGTLIKRTYVPLGLGLFVATLGIAKLQWMLGDRAERSQHEDDERVAQAANAKFRWGDAVVVGQDRWDERHLGERAVVIEVTDDEPPQYVVEFADHSSERVPESVLHILETPAGQ